MKIRTNRMFVIITVVMCWAVSSLAHATAIFNIVPSSTTPINISTTGNAFLTYTVTNNTNKTTISNITVEPGYGIPANQISLSLQSDSCSGSTLAVGASCTFGISMKGLGQTTSLLLMPRVCGFSGAICSEPVAGNRVSVIVGPKITTLAYVVNEATSSISLCLINSITGKFNSCIDSGGTGFNFPTTMAINSSGTLGYVTNSGNGTVTLCSINSTGALTGCIDSGVGAAFNLPFGIALNSLGTMAYVTNLGLSTVSLCTINQLTGAFSACVDSGVGAIFNGAVNIAINQSGTLVYVNNSIANSVLICQVNQITGQLSACVDSGGGGQFANNESIAFNPSGTKAYVADADINLISLCNVNQSTGFLSNCITTGNGLNIPTVIALNTQGTNAYIVNFASQSVSLCNINQSTGLLSCADSGIGAAFNEPFGITLN